MKANRTLGGILLVSGTAIGAGMLALPTATANTGFLASLITFLVAWGFMTLAALYVFEVNLWLPGDKDLLSMAKTTLGSWGKLGMSLCYLILLYALISAYIQAGSAWLVAALAHYAHIQLPTIWGIALFIGVFGIPIAYGTGLVDHFNRYLMAGLCTAYVLLVILAIPHLQPKLLQTTHLSTVTHAIPLMLTSFGFSIIIPSLTHYLNRDIRKMLWIIAIGGAIPLLVYVIWEAIILGILPLEHLQQLAQQDDGIQVVFALAKVLNAPGVSYAGQMFAILALLTSFLGLGLSLFHFLADAIKPKTHKRSLIFACTFVPPILINLLIPSGFERILSFSGIIIAVLLGILPVCMVWRGRYYLQHRAQWRVWGGKPLLLIVGLFFTGVVLQEGWRLF